MPLARAKHLSSRVHFLIPSAIRDSSPRATLSVGISITCFWLIYSTPWNHLLQRVLFGHSCGSFFVAFSFIFLLCSSCHPVLGGSCSIHRFLVPRRCQIISSKRYVSMYFCHFQEPPHNCCCVFCQLFPKKKKCNDHPCAVGIDGRLRANGVLSGARNLTTCSERKKNRTFHYGQVAAQYRVSKNESFPQPQDRSNLYDSLIQENVQ